MFWILKTLRQILYECPLGTESVVFLDVHCSSLAGDWQTYYFSRRGRKPSPDSLMDPSTQEREVRMARLELQSFLLS